MPCYAPIRTSSRSLASCTAGTSRQGCSSRPALNGDVETASTPGLLHDVERPMQHCGRFVDLALADACEGEVPQDDRLGLRSILEGPGGLLQDQLRTLGIVEKEVARAGEPSMLCG